MKPGSVILAVLTALSLALQAAGIFAVIRSNDTEDAYKLREIASRHLPYVSGRLSSAGGLNASDSCAILTIPSFFNGMVSETANDTLTIYIKDRKLFFSYYPAEGSDRQHETIYIGNTDSFVFREVDGFIYFEVKTGGMERTFNFYKPRGLTLISEGGLL